eukprot:scaffold281915_cov26-Tisochrysis_lutea.AAC.1
MHVQMHMQSAGCSPVTPYGKMASIVASALLNEANNQQSAKRLTTGLTVPPRASSPNQLT